MNNSDIASARRWFAEELRYVSCVRSSAVIAAFANVPREHFAGAGPWRLLSPMAMSGYWTTADADPRHLYHDVLIALDETRRLNNGQPSLWAFVYDQLDLAAGQHIVHIGTGTGYYTAILADITGRDGRITAIEIDADLAERTRTNLAPAWPQANVITADGFVFRPDLPADAIIVNAGVTHFATPWLDALTDNGRLLVPLTNEQRWGAFVLITRRPGEPPRYAARHVCRVGIIDCVGGRDDAAQERLATAIRRHGFASIQSLRRPPEEPDDTCWLAGDGWWLSTAPPKA